MPFPIIPILIAAGGTLLAAKKGHDAYTDNKKANRINDEAQGVFDRAKRNLVRSRNETKDTLTELGRIKANAWANQLGRFVELVEPLRNVKLEGNAQLEQLTGAPLTAEELRMMKQISLKFGEAMGGGAVALGSGALMGVATYGGAMMFATASTGTAIGTLSGVAATNATLAWFGGGSLAAGGMGMAGGMMVLGSVVAAPVLAVGGMVLASKAKEKLANARKNLAQARRAASEMNSAKSVVDAIRKVAAQFTDVTEEMVQRANRIFDDLENIIQSAGTNYRTYSPAQKQKVHLAYLTAQSLRTVIEAPLLTQDGAVDPDCNHVLGNARKFLKS